MKNGRVIRILNKDIYGCPVEVVVDVGEVDGVTSRSQFLLYVLGEEIQNPDGGESLGRLEIVRGRGKAKHVQSRLTTVVPLSKTKRTIRRTSGGGLMFPAETVEEEEELLPFDRDLKEGDWVRVLP
jgi:hypothetical protein